MDDERPGLDGLVDGMALDLVPGHLLRRCQQRAVDLFAAAMGKDGPTPRQFALLLCLAQNPGISQTALVARSGIDRSTLAEMLRRTDRPRPCGARAHPGRRPLLPRDHHPGWPRDAGARHPARCRRPGADPGADPRGPARDDDFAAAPHRRFAGGGCKLRGSPLTLSLSRRERERRDCLPHTSQAPSFRPVAGTRHRVPSPLGEGQGEGLAFERGENH